MLAPAVRIEIQDVAARYSAPAHRLMAVVEVESAGVVFWNVNGKSVPAARPEGHYFYARLKGSQRDEAVRQGLAHPRMGGVPVPRQREAVYSMIDRMIAINEQAAIESCSWGLGQVMGANWRELGYSSARALYDENQSGLSGQVECMMKFIVKNGLLDELQRGDFKAFAARYNGPSYAVNAYDTKMATAAAKYERVLQGPKEAQAVFSEEVKRIQKNMADLGYFKGAIDGTEEADLNEAISCFQRENGLVVDGRYGQMTSKTVDEQIAKKINGNANNTVGAGVGGLTISSMGEQLLSQVQMLGNIPYLKPTVMILTVACVLLIAYGLWRKYKAGQLV
jgi:hypothetical protein